MASREATEVLQALDGTPEFPDLYRCYVKHQGWLSQTFESLVAIKRFITQNENFERARGAVGWRGTRVADWHIANLVTRETWTVDEFRTQFASRRKKRSSNGVKPS